METVASGLESPFVIVDTMVSNCSCMRVRASPPWDTLSQASEGSQLLGKLLVVA